MLLRAASLMFTVEMVVGVLMGGVMTPVTKAVDVERCVGRTQSVCLIPMGSVSTLRIVRVTPSASMARAGDCVLVMMSVLRPGFARQGFVRSTVCRSLSAPPLRSVKRGAVVWMRSVGNPVRMVAGKMRSVCEAFAFLHWSCPPNVWLRPTATSTADALTVPV